MVPSIGFAVFFEILHGSYYRLECIQNVRMTGSSFDKVPHQRLLLKLKAHGIGDGIVNWIEQWLTDLGVEISADMIVSEQCGITASEGNQILGLIWKNITYKEKRQLYLCIKQ